MDHIIQWTEKAIALTNEYPSVDFSYLEQLLVQTHILKAERYRVLIDAKYLQQSQYKIAQFAATAIDNFVQGADKQAIGMGLKSRIPLPAELESMLQQLLLAAIEEKKKL